MALLWGKDTVQASCYNSLFASFPRACLGLFPAPPPPAVQCELNLIASLSLLDDFSVSLLPVQVRLCENKLDMIRRVLDASATSYKRYDKVCLKDIYLVPLLLALVFPGTKFIIHVWP